MMRKWLEILIIILTCAVPCVAQYTNQLYDGDSSADWGYHVLITTDSNLFIYGGGWGTNNKYLNYTMVLSMDGTQQIDKKVFRSDVYSMGIGDPGRLKQLLDGRYVCDWTLSAFSAIRPQFGYQTGNASLIVFNHQGDSVFTRSYTDTSVNYDFLYDCTVLPDGGYLLCGERTPFADPAQWTYGLLIRTDSAGNELWEKTYENPHWYGFETVFHSVQAQPDGRVLVGGWIYTNKVKTIGLVNLDYYLVSPWFMQIDTLGNLLKDTVYKTRYAGGGNIFRDPKGGYYHWGRLDSFITDNPLDIQNLPDYVAHLDDSFHFEWLHTFDAAVNSDTTGRKYIAFVKELSNGDFVVCGSALPPLSQSKGVYVGWVSKIDRQGHVIWDNTYTTDNSGDGYLEDVAERVDGSLLMIGSNRRQDLPGWQQSDVWIISTDSNGCIQPGCTPTKIKQVLYAPTIVSIYPNPTNGMFNISSPKSGILTMYNMEGQQTGTYTINSGTTQLQLPSSLSAGIYSGRFQSKDGIVTIVKIVYQP